MEKIEANAFNGRNYIIKLLIPNHITSIGVSSFSDCTGLKEINYKGVSYDKTPNHTYNDFKTAFEADGGTISSSAFTGSGIL